MRTCCCLGFRSKMAPPPGSAKGKGKGCLLGCGLVLAGVGIVAALAVGGLLTSVRNLISSEPSGKLLGATVVEDAQGRSVLWMLVDEGVYILTTVSRPGYKSTGERCYLFCHSTVFAMDLKSGEVLLRDTIDDSDSPGAKASLTAAGHDVWAVLPAGEDRAPIARHYDGAEVALKRDTTAVLASDDQLSAGLVDASVSGTIIEMSTKDGRTVQVPMSSEAASDAPERTLPFFLVAESRANKARLKLVRLAGAEGLDAAELARIWPTSALTHTPTLDRIQRNLDRTLDKRARKAGRHARRQKSEDRRHKSRVARIARLRASAGKVSGKMRRRLMEMADKMQAQVDEVEAGAAEDEAPDAAPDPAESDAGGKADPRLEALADDRVFLEGWIAAQDAEYVFIIHQQTAGKRSDRLLTCIDMHGKARWTLQADQLPDILERDDANRAFSTTAIVKWRLKIERHADAVILTMKPDDVRVYDLNSGELRLSLDL